MVLATSEIPPGVPATEPLVCPLDVHPRSAAALAGFLTTNTQVLRTALVEATGVAVDEARERANNVMAALDSGTVHVISSTWSVPLPWFAIVEPAERKLVLGDSAVRELSWRTSMAHARQRTARAYAVTKNTMGEEGPAAVLRDTGRWLENFHAHSVVELDYGGLADLLTDEALTEDSSVPDVHAILEAMEAGDATEIATRYQKLREFWAKLASHERLN